MYKQWLVPAYLENPADFPMASTCLQLSVTNHATAHTLNVATHLRKIVYILTFLLILSCKNKTTEIRYYPTDFQFPLENFEIIGLDTTKLNFRQITNRVINNDFNSDFGNILVEFDDGEIKKRVMPYFYGNGLYKEKNILKINCDSILIDNNYPISELKRILKRHYLNKGEIPYYSASPQKTLVEVTIDTSKNGKEIKELLTKLTRTFDEIKHEINDTIELRVFFDYYRQLPPPPPPPKMEEENETE